MRNKENKSNSNMVLHNMPSKLIKSYNTIYSICLRGKANVNRESGQTMLATRYLLPTEYFRHCCLRTGKHSPTKGSCLQKQLWLQPDIGSNITVALPSLFLEENTVIKFLLSFHQCSEKVLIWSLFLHYTFKYRK